jgi:hypothetical protein
LITGLSRPSVPAIRGLITEFTAIFILAALGTCENKSINVDDPHRNIDYSLKSHPFGLKQGTFDAQKRRRGYCALGFVKFARTDCKYV